MEEIKIELNRVIQLFEKIDDVEIVDVTSCKEAGFKDEQDFKYIEDLRNRASNFIECVLSQFNYDEEEQVHRRKDILSDLIKVYLLKGSKKYDD